MPYYFEHNNNADEIAVINWKLDEFNHLMSNNNVKQALIKKLPIV